MNKRLPTTKQKDLARHTKKQTNLTKNTHTLRIYLWWSLRTLCLLTQQVRVYHRQSMSLLRSHDVFQVLINSLCYYFYPGGKKGSVCVFSFLVVCVCVHVCVCMHVRMHPCVCMHVCASVCNKERERERIGIISYFKKDRKETWFHSK